MQTVQERVVNLDHNGGVCQVINVSRLVPEGQMLKFDSRLTGGAAEIWVGPLTYWSIKHEGRLPLESRYERGRIELERDRRRYPRKDT